MCGVATAAVGTRGVAWQHGSLVAQGAGRVGLYVVGLLNGRWLDALMARKMESGIAM